MFFRVLDGCEVTGDDPGGLAQPIDGVVRRGDRILDVAAVEGGNEVAPCRDEGDGTRPGLRVGWRSAR
jgi:hypothetical protein